ncbi:DUF2282 domain-containing protein [Amaricoccus macauensis]|uniref:BufA1 family periplasmic bufferin-type metallophore n=1 Tax=Amaricoccus macauensis TaxID=57001 RepID=UPI003C7E1CDF
MRQFLHPAPTRALRGAAALFLAVAFVAGSGAPAPAQSQERCYGVALAGENDGIGDHVAPGESRHDYQGNAWIFVPQGTCTTMVLPVQPDGTPRRGALEPLTRDTGS